MRMRTARTHNLKFPPFAYIKPSSLADVIGAFTSEPEARALAGGQSLLPLLAMRLTAPPVLVDLSGVSELSFIERTPDVIRIGAMTTQADCLGSPIVREQLPLLHEALSFVAHPAIRNRGTIGGSLAHGDSAAELPVVMVALAATIQVAGPHGERSIPASEFFLGSMTTALEQGEVLTHVDIPVRRGHWAFTEVSRRHGDFALVMAAVGLDIASGGCSWARVVLGAVSDRPLRSLEAESALAGRAVDDDAARAAGHAASKGLTPSSDIHATGHYRKQVAGVLVRRAILAAAARVS
jgi:CO/xanthine dehydrogenase FAD-binding subunit